MSLTETEEKQILIDILKIKKDILQMIYHAQSGHPGGSLSSATILSLLYNKIMKVDKSNSLWKDRDIFILSKGHAAPALYAFNQQN